MLPGKALQIEDPKPRPRNTEANFSPKAERQCPISVRPKPKERKRLLWVQLFYPHAFAGKKLADAFPAKARDGFIVPQFWGKNSRSLLRVVCRGVGAKGPQDSRTDRQGKIYDEAKPRRRGEAPLFSPPRFYLRATRTTPIAAGGDGGSGGRATTERKRQRSPPGDAVLDFGAGLTVQYTLVDSI